MPSTNKLHLQILLVITWLLAVATYFLRSIARETVSSHSLQDFSTIVTPVLLLLIVVIPVAMVYVQRSDLG